MRTTRGKEALHERLTGDDALARILADSLKADGEVDRATHGFHTYPAGLHPDAAKLLVETFPEGDVLDPFCGGGTVLIEAVLAGRRATGLDVSAVALRVARARTRMHDAGTLTAFRSASRKMVERARGATEPPPPEIYQAVRNWYEPHVLAEIESLRQGVVAAEEPVKALLEVALSSLLIKASFRQSDTSQTRVPHSRPRGTTAILFHKKCRELARRLESLRALSPEGTPAPDVRAGDARRGPPPQTQFGLALTSPPYPSTYDYVPMQHLRQVWFDWTSVDSCEIGARRTWRLGEREAKQQWEVDTQAWTQAVARALKPGGHLVVVIGDGLTPSGAVDSYGPTVKAGLSAGLELAAAATVTRPDHARQLERLEHVIALRKPSAGHDAR